MSNASTKSNMVSCAGLSIISLIRAEGRPVLDDNLDIALSMKHPWNHIQTLHNDPDPWLNWMYWAWFNPYRRDEFRPKG